MQPIRIKACSESDLRMLGNLARNIQRVLPVTQADIDAAAAQGKAWVVKPVVKVSDPLDNLRGGTQLVIKQNSILPGQNVMRVIYVGGQAVVVGPGTSPLPLPDAAADDILSLIAFGGTQQEGVPQEYTRLDRLQGDGNAYIDLGITLNQDDEIEVDFIFKYASGSQIFGYRDNASSKNITLFSGGGPGSLFMDFNNSDYTNYRLGTTGTDDAQYTAKISKAKRALYSGTTEIVANNTTCPDTFTTGNALLFFAGGNPSGTAKFTGSILGVRIKDRMNLVPAKRNSDSVLGMYDMITGQFFTNAAGSGAFIAGDPMAPTPAYPADIVCNNGVLKARHQSGLPLGYTLLEYIESDGNSYIDTNLLLSNTSEFEITFQSADATLNTPVMGSISGGTSFTSTNNLCVTYTVASGLNAYSVYCDGAAGDANHSWNGGDAQDKLKHTVKYNGLNIAPTLDGVDMEQLVPTTLTTNTPTVTTWLFGRNNTGSGTKTQTGVRIYDFNVVGIAHFVPCKNASNVVGMYDLVSGQFFTNQGTGTFTAGTAVSDPVEVYTAGPIETIAIKDDQDATVSTATCEDLLSVGTYTDEQEIISGVVTRKVGVKVLDGTETGWVKLSGVNYVSLPKTAISNMVSGTDATCLSDKFVQVPHSNISLSEECFSVGASYVNFKKSGDPTVAQFKQWLAQQYAAGTPVIVIYPLATATTESVTGQPMQTAAGDNTAEITQAGMAGLELEVEYVEA